MNNELEIKVGLNVGKILSTCNIYIIPYTKNHKVKVSRNKPRLN